MINFFAIRVLVSIVLMFAGWFIFFAYLNGGEVGLGFAWAMALSVTGAAMFPREL